MSQISTRFITPNSIDDTLLRLRNNQYLRARNNAGSGDVNVLRVNSSDRIEFPSAPQSSSAPSTGNDLTNKTYVDALVNGLDWKQSVRVATTGAGTLSTSFENGDTIDGVALVTGDRILIKDQATGSENGIYTVNATGAPTRSTDADSSAEVTAGLAVFIEEGTTNADTGWVLSTNNPIVLGTDALVFAQFSSSGSITAGAGLTKTGNTIDFVAGDTSLTVNANDASVNLATNGGLETSSGVKIKPDTSTANTLALTLTSNGAGTKYDPNSFSESSEALTLAAGVAGAGLGLSSGVLAVNVDSTTIEISGDAVRIAASAAGAGLSGGGGSALAVNVDNVTTKISTDTVVGQSNKKETFTLSGTNITNQYLDMTQVAATDSIIFMVQGSGNLLEGASYDYSVSYTGGAGGKTRITFLNDLATGGAAALIAGDIVQVNYMYL